MKEHMVFQKLYLEKYYAERIFCVSILTWSTAGWSNAFIFNKRAKRIVSKTKKVNTLPNSTSSFLLNTNCLNGILFYLKIFIVALLCAYNIDSIFLFFNKLIFFGILIAEILLLSSLCEELKKV